MEISVETKGMAAVAWMKGTKHKFYEDRFRLLCQPVPLVSEQDRGEIFAVFDGIGSAPKGMAAAQFMCDVLVKFYREPEKYPASYESIEQLMMEANREIFNWGFMPGTDRPLGGCAGTLVWLHKEAMHVFHAGDTIAILVRDGIFEQLTALHELDGSIYRYFGFGENLKIDVSRHGIEESDRILLMSDGVTKAMIPAEIKDFSEQYHDKAVAVREIVNRSRNKGSQDDITAMIIEVEFEF